MSVACVGSTCSVLAILGLPPLTGVCFPCLHCSGSQLLYMERALRCMWFQFSGTPQKRGLSWACVLCLPWPEQLRQPGAWQAQSPRVWCALSPPWSQPQFPRVPVGCVSLVSVLGSWPLAATLPVSDAGVWGTFLLGVAFRHVICGFYLFFLPVRLPSEIQKFPPDPPVRGFPGVRKLPLLQLPSQDGSPSLALLSLFLSFIFCPTSFRRQWAAFLGAWCPLLAIRSCFVQFAQCSNVLSMNL